MGARHAVAQSQGRRQHFLRAPRDRLRGQGQQAGLDFIERMVPGAAVPVAAVVRDETLAVVGDELDRSLAGTQTRPPQ